MPIFPKRNENPLDTSTPGIPESVMKKAKDKEVLQWLFENAAKYEQKHGLPPGIMLSLAGHESGHYQRDSASGTGPKGLFQMTEKMARVYGLKVDGTIDERLDLDKTTDAAARLLSDNLKQHKGDVVKALAQYNGGSKAPDWLDGRAHLYDTGNGNPGELYGFLRGVAKYAKEWGNEELFNQLQAGYQGSEEAIIGMKQEMKAKGLNVTEDGSWDKKTKGLYEQTFPKPSEVDPKVNLPKPNTNIFKTVPEEEIEEPKVKETPTPPAPVKEIEPVPVAEQKRDPKEIRIYEEGGKLTQVTDDGAQVPLQGAERIYSIPDTKKIIQMAKNANDQKGLRELGEFVYKATKKQDEREPEFTED